MKMFAVKKKLKKNIFFFSLTILQAKLSTYEYNINNMIMIKNLTKIHNKSSIHLYASV